MDQVLGSSSEDVQKPPVPGGHGLTTREREQTDLSGTIRGWGSDLDPAMRPGVPYDKAPLIGVETLYPPIPQQIPKFRIHKSTEHRKLTPVFGTSCPPTGLSGRIRDYAYQFSEGRLAHYLTLMVADRVNVVEDIVADLSRGHIPNIPKEMGLATEWRYNREAFIRKTAVVAGCTALLLAVWRMRSRTA
ncbi:MAG TPA: hypothetical protein VNX25_00535 [Verrucomicrobiae bacterium]|nr:hypothetical protein [Verrucomicrobiae bacterium]